MKYLKMLVAAATTLLMISTVSVNKASAADPGPAAYAKALKGKRIMLVPMAMGFDLAQGWTAILKREVRAFGGIFETRDPNWNVDGGARAITAAISSTNKPDVLIVMSPDLNSYSKLMTRAQHAGVYVILIDNPANFKADAYIGADWNRLGQMEAEAVIKRCGPNSTKKIGLVQGDEVNATSLYQYAGIMAVLDQHPGFKVVAKPDSNWNAATSRNVTTTMLRQHPDMCGVIDFWDGDATGAAAAIRDAKLQGKIDLVTTGGGEETTDCDLLSDGRFSAVVSTELVNESEAMVAMIKYLLQSGRPAGSATTYIYTLLTTVTQENMTPRSCWNLKALQAQASQ